MKEEQIRRINELYHKSKEGGLTEEEKAEKDGTVTNLGEKYGGLGREKTTH